MKKLISLQGIIVLCTFIITTFAGNELIGQNNIFLNFQSNSVEFPSLSSKDVRFSNQFFLQISNQNVDPNRNYRLKLFINGSGVSMETSPNYFFNDINFDAPVKSLFSTDLAPYFDIENLEVSGISAEEYLINGLPEGVYRVCFKLYDVTSDSYVEVSNSSCVNLWIRHHLPPSFTSPSEGKVIGLDENILYSWMPRHVSINPVKYRLLTYEYLEGLTDVDYLESQIPVLNEELFAQQYFYNSSLNLLKRGKKYISFVKVEGINNNLFFKNGGYSNPLIFEMDHKFISDVYEPGRTEEGETHCDFPAARFFINEVSNGRVGTRQEFIELVAIGTDTEDDNVDLEGYIIDDNNFMAYSVGNEDGHIRLGSCLNDVPRGSIILIYDDSVPIAGIDPNKDDETGANGVYQIPFSSSCILKYGNCPRVSSDDPTYDCTKSSSSTLKWWEVIPMYNQNDVMQLRDPEGELEHAVLWLTDKYEHKNAYKTVDIDVTGNAGGKNFIFNRGDDWNEAANWDVVNFPTQSSPGEFNGGANGDNALFVQSIVDAYQNGLGNNFFISCSQQLFYNSVGINIMISGGIPGSRFRVTINGEVNRITTQTDINITGLDEGIYNIEVYDYATGCTDYCDVEIIFECTIGEECNDFNECTVMDVLDADCNCAGTPIENITFNVDPVYEEFCDYCTTISFVDPLYSYVTIHEINFEKPNGDVISLNVGDNGPIFNFPYCLNITNGCPVEQSGMLIDDLNEWINASSEYSGQFSYLRGYCGPALRRGADPEPAWYHIYLAGTNLTMTAIEATSDIGDNFTYYIHQEICVNTPNIIGYTLNVESTCDSIVDVSWSNGDTSQTIFIPNILSCYEVTIQCETGCVFTETYMGGEVCECIVGSPCPYVDECTIPGSYNEDCECENISLPDSDGDTVCDDLDECPGFDDLEDTDMDGVPDGCDICHGVNDSLYLVLINDQNPFNDPKCGPYPCNDEIEVTVDTFGSSTCEYCFEVDVKFPMTNTTVIKSVTMTSDGSDRTWYGASDLEEISFDDFENDMGSWIDGGDDCARFLNSSHANSGQYSVRLRDNSASSKMTSNVMNMNETCLVKVDFSYKVVSFDSSDEDFWLQISTDGGSNFVTVEEWNLNDEFQNDERHNETVYIGGPFSSNTVLRFKCDASSNTDYVYIDDVRISNRKRLDFQCTSTEYGLYGLANVINDMYSEFEVDGNAIYYPNGSPTCSGDPNDNKRWLHVTGSRVKLVSFQVIQEGVIRTYNFESPDCGDLEPGQYEYDLSVNTVCVGQTVLWSNGETTDTITVPSLLGAYEVMVTCPDGCVYTDTIGDPSCLIGLPCQTGDPCYPAGTLDAYCNCAIDYSVFDDFDEDGIPDECDICWDNWDHGDYDGDGIPDCQEAELCPCLTEPYLDYTAIENLVCDQCYDLTGHENFNLRDVTYQQSGNTIELSDLLDPDGYPYFDFPYCTLPNTNPDCGNTHGINSFISDLYQWLVITYPGISPQVNLQQIPNDPCIGTDYGIRITSSPHDFTFEFSNGNEYPQSGNCNLDTTGYLVQLNIEDCLVCPPGSVTYEWSDGSTGPAPYIPIVPLSTTGYSVTVTCEKGCAFIVTTPGINNCFVGEPCDDADICTAEGTSTYDINCFCTGGQVLNDMDGDGVCDLVDVCQGFDDNIDTDYDGVPNGCDICEGQNDNNPDIDLSDCPECDFLDAVTYYTYTADLTQPDCQNEYLLVTGLNLILPDGSSEDIGYSDVAFFSFPYCFDNIGTCPSGGNIATMYEFAQDLEAWLDFFGYGGNVNWDPPTIAISATQVQFTQIYFYCGNISSRPDSRNAALFAIPFDLKYSWNDYSGTTGAPCDDGWECTVNDAWNEDCECEGIYVDSDEDTVCDPLDQCPGYPDYLGCSSACLPQGILLCEYFENMYNCSEPYNNISIPNPKALQQDMKQVQEVLYQIFQESDWEPLNFNIPQLTYEIQNMNNSNGDADGDGLINFFDPIDDASNPTPGLFTLTEIQATCNMQDRQLNVMKYFMFTVVDYINEPSGDPECNDSNVAPIYPGCADETGIMVYQDDYCVLREVGSDKAVHFEIDCECNCIKTLTSSPDEVDLTVCDIPCENVGCDIYGIIPNPNYDPSAPSGPGNVPCTCELIGEGDEDGDTVCDVDDVCPGQDDLADNDGDGIPNCLDECPNTPGSIGDSCDDGDECTYADVVQYDEATNSCFCKGYDIDLDADGVRDCEPCDAAHDTDGDGYIDAVDMVMDPDLGIMVPYCDVCPDLDDKIDANGNNIPDCIEPLHYQLGCPDTFQIVEGEGIVLFFDSQEITLDQLPQPISITLSASNTANNSIVSNDYLIITNIRETPDAYEVFYALPEITSQTYDFVGVTFSEHQQCILSDSDAQSVDLDCPEAFEFTASEGQLELTFNLPPGFNYDLLGLQDDITFNLQGSGSDITGSHAIDLQNTIPDGNSLTISFYGFSGIGPMSSYSGTISLPNGTECSITNGTLDTDCEYNGEQVSFGDPCDDDDDCTHHDKIVDDGMGGCDCEGEMDPDSDGDGLCDEIDPCPDDVNDDLDGDGEADLEGCPCPDVTINGAAVVNGSDFELDLDMSGIEDFSHVSVTITGGPEEINMDSMTFSSPFVVPNLPPGYLLTVTITGNCINGGTSSSSAEAYIPFETNPVLCGISMDSIDLSSYTFLPSLNKDDVFKASDFDITVREASGQYGTFTGKGYIKVPYLNFVRVNVTFDNIMISAERQMVQGVVIVSGYGLAILGDDISDAINDGLNDILNVLEDIDDMLEALIPILENIDELISTTSQLVDESTLNCLQVAQANLEALQNQTPPPSEIDLQTAAAELQTCHDLYVAELLTIIEGFGDLIEYSINEQATHVDCDLNALLTVYNDNIDTYKDIFLTEKADIIQSLPGGGSGGLELSGEAYSFSETITNLDLDPTEEQAILDFWTDLLAYDYCLAMSKLNEAVIQSQWFWLLVDEVKALMSLMLVVGEEIIELVSEDIKNEVSSAEIYSEHEEAIKTAFQKVVVNKSYRTY